MSGNHVKSLFTKKKQLSYISRVRVDGNSDNKSKKKIINKKLEKIIIIKQNKK